MKGKVGVVGDETSGDSESKERNEREEKGKCETGEYLRLEIEMKKSK